MKENSIEEDIKIIENLKEAINSGLCYFGSVTMDDCGYQEALEHILSDYKRALKENEELKKSKITYEKVRDIQEKNRNIVDNKYISKQKVKDKIEHYQKLQDNYIEKYDEINEGLQAMINALQELLEGRK